MQKRFLTPFTAWMPPGRRVEDDDLQRAVADTVSPTLQNFGSNNSFAKSLEMVEVLGRGGHLRPTSSFQIAVANSVRANVSILVVQLGDFAVGLLR